MNNIKVLFIYGSKLYYGHERANLKVLSILNGFNFNITVLSNRDGIPEKVGYLLKKENVENIPIAYPKWSSMRKPHTLSKSIQYVKDVILHNRAVLKEYKRLRPDYIYIANDFNYINLIPTLIFKKARVVYRLGDEPTIWWKPFQILWKYYISKRTYKFVCISKFIKQKLTCAGRDLKNQDIVIYNFPPERPKINLTQIPFVKTGYVFSYLGQIIKIKGVEEFVDAAVRICQFHQNVFFLIAGDLDYDLSFSNSLINKVKLNNLERRIIFLGGIENIEDFFIKTDVLVTPSIKQEPLGNVIVEAKENSTPSIIFNSGGMPELINHKSDGFICHSSNVESLVEGIEFYLNDPNLIKDHSVNAKKSIKDLSIDYESFKKKWFNVFQ